MADQSVSIEMKATTAAAVAEVDKLAGAIRESTTAASVAGSAQQQLGKDVALTAAKVRDSKEAVAAAKQALETHDATVKAFGANSTQAAQSAAKLAAAEREASKAATEAASALAKTAKEVQAVAAAEDGQLSPATKRAAAQVARMGEAAERTAHDLNKMELQQKRGSAGFDLMGFAGGKLMSVLGPAALGGTIVALAGWLGDAAEKTLQYESALANIPFSIDGARKATHGLVAEQMLVSAAASASSLKVTKTAADFELLAGASVKLAQKLGQPADQLLNNLVTALGRGSTELLDNAGVVLKTAEAQERYAASIGVSVSAMTDEQKASAFKIEAMKAILKAADETTIAFDSNAASVVRLKVKTADAWDSMSRAAANGVGSMFATVESASTAVTTLRTGLIETALAMDTTWSPAFKSGATDAATWAAEMLGVADTVDGIRLGLTDPSVLAAMDAANDKERAKRDMLSEEADFSERMAKAAANVEKANTAFLDAQAAAAVVYGPAAPDKAKRKAGGKAKPDAEFSSNSGTNAIVRGFDGVEQTELVARAAPEAAAEGRAEREAALFDQRMQRYDREAEMLDAQGQHEAERVDMIFSTLDIEDEAEARRRDLQDQRLKREQEYARWQVRNARTEAQREQAQTKLEAVEHKKRVLTVQRAADEERKTLEHRRQIVGAVTAQVTSLGSVMIDSIEAMVNGQRGALARGLADWTKDLAKRMGLKALEEGVLAIASAASFNYPAAAAHGTAAGMALAVAVAAGGASAGLGAAASSAERGGAAANGSGAANGGGSTGSGGKPSGGSSNLERMDVPVSYDRTGPAPGGVTVVIQIANFTGGKDAAKALGEQVKRSLEQSKAQGKRY